MGTKKPCPGCGKTDDYRRQVGAVCETCAAQLRHYLGMKNEIEDMREKMTAVKGPYLSKVINGVPVGGYLRGLTTDETEPVNSSCRQLIRTLVRPYSHMPSFYESQSVMGERSYKITVKEEGYEAIEAHLKSLKDAMELAYIKGWEDGTNILKRMHSGDESAHDFSEQERRLARKRRAIEKGEPY